MSNMGLRNMSRQRIRTIIACTMITGGGHGFLYNTLSIYVKPVSDDLGLARGSFSIYSSIIMITAVFMLPLFGELYRHKNLKRILLICSLSCPLATLGFSISSRVWQFYFFAILFGLGFNGINLSVAANIINNWFDRNKGIATGISFAGSGFFAAAMVNILGRVIPAFGWRWSYRIAAVGSLLMVFPAVLLLLKICPDEEDLKVDDGEFAIVSGSQILEQKGMTRAEAVHTPMFYLLISGGFLLAATVQAQNLNIAAALSDAGHPEAVTTMAASISLVTLGIGKIVIGKVFDRLGMLYSLLLFAAAAGISCLFLLHASFFLTPYLLPVAAGLGSGGCQVSLSCFVRSIFGNKEFSRIYALFNMAQFLGTATGASVPSLLFDQMGSYTTVWYILLGTTLLSVVLYYLSYYFQGKWSGKDWKVQPL